MRTTVLKIAGFLALASAVAIAQRPGRPDSATMIQHRVNFLAERLGLSSSQQQQATTIFTNAMNGMQSMHEQMRSAHQALNAAITKGDNGGIDQAANTIGNLMAQQTAAHAKAEAQFLQILGPDQQAKYSQLHEPGPGGFAFGRQFGHGGPPE